MMTGHDRENLRRYLNGRSALELAIILELAATAAEKFDASAANHARRSAGALDQTVGEMLERGRSL